MIDEKGRANFLVEMFWRSIATATRSYSLALAINRVVAILGYYAIMMWGLVRG